MFFELFCITNAEDDYINQRLGCASPKHWSKYTTDREIERQRKRKTEKQKDRKIERQKIERQRKRNTVGAA